MTCMVIYAWKPRPRQSRLVAAALACFAVLPTSVTHVEGQSWEDREAVRISMLRPWEERELARDSILYNIAVQQAMRGDYQGAKQTVSEIGRHENVATAQVTVVSFCNGQPIYCVVPPANFEPAPPVVTSVASSPGWGGRDSNGTQYFLAADRPADRLPSRLPPDLPSNYLAVHPRHGAVVDFSDERDANGTRVTSRRYADGHVVIETLPK
jgi:hypothetical protein